MDHLGALGPRRGTGSRELHVCSQMQQVNFVNSTNTLEGDQTRVYSKYPTFESSESNRDKA